MIFHKYQGTGNDFILIDERTTRFDLTTKQIAALCHRHFGIGADGLMLLRNAEGYDFRMVYYNADGNESSMCGNGGRCIAAFAKQLGIVTDRASFIAIDGPHTAQIRNDGNVSLQMADVSDIRMEDGHTILNTGSPHYVKWVNNIDDTDVFEEGRHIRYSDAFRENGINVNFAEVMPNGLKVRTYERGVEDETMSCGTGVTAAAIASSSHVLGHFTTDIETPGGRLNVSFLKTGPTSAKNVVLTGPAKFVFAGETNAY